MTCQRPTGRGPARSTGSCHPETTCKLYDVELHAIARSFKYRSEKSRIEGHVICVDNQVAFQTFIDNNPNNSKYT